MTQRTERLALHRATESRLQKAARRVDQVLPGGVLFALLTFIPNTDGGVSYSGYISNAHRDDMIKALRECANALEAKRDAKPGEPVPEVH